jgi:hypothetical protein
VAIGLLGVVAFAAASAERRRRRALAAAPRSGGDALAGALPPPNAPQGSAAGALREGWERYVHYPGDDETVGTIEYEPPPERPT